MKKKKQCWPTISHIWPDNYHLTSLKTERTTTNADRNSGLTKNVAGFSRLMWPQSYLPLKKHPTKYVVILSYKLQLPCCVIYSLIIIPQLDKDKDICTCIW
jgi:hypothetical protein